MERLNAGLLLHFLNEQSENGELDTPYIKSSMDRYWANCIRHPEERAWISKTIRRTRARGPKFSRDMYEAALQRRTDTGSFANHSSTGDDPDS